MSVAWLDSSAMFEISFIPAFKDNYIWLLRLGRHAAVVDPGDAVPVIARLEAEGLQLDSILITHHHADHQGGIPALLERWPTAVVYGPAEESITGCTHPLSGGEVIEVLGQGLEVWSVAGHTRGHLAYRGPGVLFCGDTLFGAGCGRLFEGTPAQMADALTRIAALPDATLIYCAHEYTAMNLPFALAVEPANAVIQARIKTVAAQRERAESTVPLLLGEEKASNPFLRCQESAVVATAQAQGASADPVSVFAALRAWRNDFRA